MQYDRLKKHNAFIDNYKKQPMFADSLDEFDSAREVVQSMVEEYKASERADYATWGQQQQQPVGAAGSAGGDVRM